MDDILTSERNVDNPSRGPMDGLTREWQDWEEEDNRNISSIIHASFVYLFQICYLSVCSGRRNKTGIKMCVCSRSCLCCGFLFACSFVFPQREISYLIKLAVGVKKDFGY
mmetsp:Transcript_22869/g.47710  ORF Transcript_22869/g.47710 Transcript_22869/m.47710 type:complete len:110 (+) Transcript_22869:952-1281(+)